MSIYDEIIDMDDTEDEWIGPCAHGRDPYDRCDLCGEMPGWAAKELADTMVKLRGWGLNVPFECGVDPAILRSEVVLAQHLYKSTEQKRLDEVARAETAEAELEIARTEARRLLALLNSEKRISKAWEDSAGEIAEYRDMWKKGHDNWVARAGEAESKCRKLEKVVECAKKCYEADDFICDNGNEALERDNALGDALDDIKDY